MFGQKDDKPQQDINANHSIDDVVTPTQGQPTDNTDWQHPGTPLDDHQPAPTSPVAATTSPGVPEDSIDTEDDEPLAEDTAPIAPAVSSLPEPTASPADAPHDLIGIKQQALSQLSPLVDHLDQSPEEKFRTTMMMIQATDDQTLLQNAYDTAQKIEDEKVRAQALLDIINEINYFTQQHKN